MEVGPYAGKGESNPEQWVRLANHVIGNIGRVLLWEVGGEIVGFLAFILFDHHFTGERTAQELAWFVLPEHRTGGAGMHLFWEAQTQAKELGAKKMQFSAPTENVGSLYKRYGYQQLEVCYQKEL